MATREYIEKRIESKKAQIEKLNKKAARIEAAKATNWEVNPYYYNEYDERGVQKDLIAAAKALEKLEAELVAEGEKASSRNVPAITEFLDKWMETTRKLYLEHLPLFFEDDNRHRAHIELLKADLRNEKDPAEKERIKRHISYEKRDHTQKWSHVTNLLEGASTYEKNLDKMLKAEYVRKYDFIIERTNRIVGQITDASNLRGGMDGELNGFIVGTKGKAKVTTIGAGGYNIQCYHFRTLINPIK